MFTIYPSQARPGTAARLQAHWFAAPLAALVYPFLLVLFHDCRTAGATLASAAALLAALAVPILALWMAARLSSSTTATNATLSAAGVRARRVALFAVATPPLFTLAGVVFLLLGHPTWDIPFMTALWITLGIGIAVASRAALPPAATDRQAARWRTAHGVGAVLAIAFLAAHFSNHILGWLGPDVHMAVMKVLRIVYRSAFVEPLLIGTFAFLIVTGCRMAWRLTARPVDGFRTFQVAGGVFLVFAVISHVNAVLYLARVHFGIDTDWGFAVGAPTGMLDDPWNIRLLPYYLLAVFFVIGHAFAGLRIVLLAHGTARRTADRLLFGGVAFGAVVAITIILAMCGMRI